MNNLNGIKPGDKVRIVSKWNENTSQDMFGSMDKYLGTIMTVKFVGWNELTMREDGGCYVWNAASIAEVLQEPPEFLIADSNEFLDFLKR